MKSMKKQWILMSKDGRILSTADGMWFPHILARGLKPDDPRHFALFSELKYAKLSMDEWNEHASVEDHVKPVRVLAGFAVISEKRDKIPDKGVGNDLVRRRDIYMLLHKLGATDGGSEWDAGWDSAIDEAVEGVKHMPSAEDPPCT